MTGCRKPRATPSWVTRTGSTEQAWNAGPAHTKAFVPQEMVREAGQGSPTQASRGNRSLAIQAVHRSCCGSEQRRGPSPQTLKIPVREPTGNEGGVG